MDCMALYKWIQWLYFHGLGGSATMEYSSYKKLKNQRKVLGCDECSARNICSQCFEKMIYTNDVLKFNCDKIRQFNRYYIASIDNININELSKLKTRN